MAGQPTSLPLTDMQAHIEKCAEKLKGQPRHCARNAFSHLRKAWSLYEIDREMSLFRAITAEEEAATALILALKERGYPGTDLLNHRNHDHKAGVWPFLQAVQKIFRAAEFAQPRIHVSLGDPTPRVDLSFSAAALGLAPEPEARIWSQEPFHFTARLGKDGEPGVVMDFQEELDELASDKGVAQLFDHVRHEANVRNQILYAQSGGIPSVQFAPPLLLTKLARVCSLLQLTIGIQQTKVHQLFAVQCLGAYLTLLRRFPPEPFDYEPADEDGDQTQFIVTRLDDDPPTVEARIKRQVTLDRLVVTSDSIDIHMTGVNDGLGYHARFEERRD